MKREDRPINYESYRDDSILQSNDPDDNEITWQERHGYNIGYSDGYDWAELQNPYKKAFEELEEWVFGEPLPALNRYNIINKIRELKQEVEK